MNPDPQRKEAIQTPTNLEAVNQIYPGQTTMCKSKQRKETGIGSRNKSKVESNKKNLNGHQKKQIMNRKEKVYILKRKAMTDQSIMNHTRSEEEH